MGFEFSKWSKSQQAVFSGSGPSVIAGIVLSTLHQSSLGSLFLITPYRLHPLWYSPIIYVLFFVSAVALGLMTVVLESLFSNYFLGHKVHRREIGGLGLAASLVLWIYLALRMGDLVVRGVLPGALDVLLSLGGILLEERRADNALEVLEEATRKHPDRADAWILMGRALADLGKLDTAVRALRKAVSLDPVPCISPESIGQVGRGKGIVPPPDNGDMED